VHRPLWPLTSVVLAGVYCLERTGTPQFGPVHWQTAGLESIVSLWTGWLLWRVAASQKGYGMRLLAGAFLLERARARSEELNDKMPRLTQLIASSTQTLSVNEVLDQVLGHLAESLAATHGMCG
jgi:hypothetical protein